MDKKERAEFLLIANNALKAVDQFRADAWYLPRDIAGWVAAVRAALKVVNDGTLALTALQVRDLNDYSFEVVARMKGRSVAVTVNPHTRVIGHAVRAWFGIKDDALLREVGTAMQLAYREFVPRGTAEQEAVEDELIAAEHELNYGVDTYGVAA